ncbi:hypothetical protein BD311DRAFT_497967 [Dichomitus squalens]|uniref:Uncharacterized protein n=1 Tax=Dichomitus squalens TaxID=114155 RepID=A0A4Q9MDM8_9APHY|nr:hypothetical protein BD311DRAFT_497967 [Dichomitus squalens]
MRTGDQSGQDVVAEVSRGVGVVRNEQEERANAPEDGGASSEGADPPCQTARALQALCTPLSPTIQVDTNEMTSSPSRLRMSGEYTPTDHEGAHSEHEDGDSERSHGLPEHGRRYLHYALAAILQVSSSKAVHTRTKLTFRASTRCVCAHPQILHRQCSQGSVANDRANVSRFA